MTEKHYCEECDCHRGIVLKERPATYNFRKEPFDIVEQYAQCTVCGKDVYHEETATHTLQQLSHMYRSKHSFTPEDIKKIRKSTGLTQTLFARILNMGEATIKRYEAGTSLPDGTQLGILKMLQKTPRLLLKFYEENKELLTRQEQGLISEKLHTLFKLQKPSISKEQLVLSITATEDFEKARNRAKQAPQYIIANGKVDTVLLDYHYFEEMYARLMELEEAEESRILTERIEQLDQQPEQAVAWKSE